ncbi:hypothetical protein JCM11641_008382 [Rhodosporidiobolus odoratus]
MSLSLALAPALPSSTSRPISTVQAHPLVLATLLDAHLRRPANQDRVFGTLLGQRSQDGTLHLQNAFPVPYEVQQQARVTIDFDHHKALTELHARVSPKETVVGWFATSPSLNSYTPLIHSFYSSETSSSSPAASQSSAVHLTLDPETLAIQAYLATPISGGGSAFSPIKVEVSVQEQDRAGLDLLTSNLTQPQPPISSSSGGGEVDADVPVQTPLAQLSSLLSHVAQMLDQTIAYVQDVVDGKREGNAQVGRRLLQTVGSVPKGHNNSGKVGGGEKKKAEGELDGLEEEFNGHLADVLMVSYLSNVIKTQSELAGRLGLLL